MKSEDVELCIERLEVDKCAAADVSGDEWVKEGGMREFHCTGREETGATCLL